jgi:hypothetical protein
VSTVFSLSRVYDGLKRMRILLILLFLHRQSSQHMHMNMHMPTMPEVDEEEATGPNLVHQAMDLSVHLVTLLLDSLVEVRLEP